MALFNNVRAFLSIESEQQNEEVKRLLLSNGARILSFLGGDSINLLVCDQPNAPHVQEAREIYNIQNVVTSNWVRLCVQFGFMFPPTPVFGPEKQIFKNLVITTSGFPPRTQPREPAVTDFLWALLTAGGATCQRTLNTGTTHLIIYKPGGAKLSRALGSGVKIVHVRWVLDSMRVGRLLDERGYGPAPQHAPVVTTAGDAQAIQNLAESLKMEAQQIQQAQRQVAPPTPQLEHPNSPLEPLDPSRFREMVEKQQVSQSQNVTAAQQPQYVLPPTNTQGQIWLQQPQSVPLSSPLDYASQPPPGAVIHSGPRMPPAHLAMPPNTGSPGTPVQSPRFPPAGRSPLASPGVPPSPYRATCGAGTPVSQASPYAVTSPQPAPRPQQPYPQYSVPPQVWQQQQPHLSPVYGQPRLPNPRMIPQPRYQPYQQPPYGPRGAFQPQAYPYHTYGPGPPQQGYYQGQYHPQPPQSPRFAMQIRPTQHLPQSSGIARGFAPVQQPLLSPTQQQSQAGFPMQTQGPFSPVGSVPYASNPQRPRYPMPPQQPPYRGQAPQYSHPGIPQEHMIHRQQFFGHEPGVNVPPEMCLLGCVFLIVDYDRIMDQKEVVEWRSVIILHGGQVENKYSERCTHVLSESIRHPVVQQALKERKRVVTAQWLNDCLAQKRMKAPWKAVHLPNLYGESKPARGKIFAASGFEPHERACLKQMISAVGGRFTGYLSKHNHFLVAKKLDTPKVEKAKEWNIPVVNVRWLTELFVGFQNVTASFTEPQYKTFDPNIDPFMLDPIVFERLSNTYQMLISSWRIPIQLSQEIWQQAGEQKERLEAEDEKLFPYKRLKMSPAPEEEEIAVRHREMVKPANTFRICFSGLFPAEQDNLSKKLLWLGGEVLTDVRAATHLVVKDLKRTKKVLEAVALAKLIVTPTWIRHSYKQQQFLDALQYIIKDDGSENFFGFNLKLSLFSAKQKRLFENTLFYLTPSVQPSQAILEDLIRAAGGQSIKQRPPCSKVAEFYEKNIPFVIITCENDLHLCHALLECGVAVHSAEFVITGILRQEVDYNAYRIEIRNNHHEQ